jgi:hypothetical protein
MLDATGKVANRVKNFPLRLAQLFLRCVALGDIELVFAKLFLLLADAKLFERSDPPTATEALRNLNFPGPSKKFLTNVALLLA